ncbi:beta-propeller domain-containing protein, partial [Candidatus Dojkabacteria bacterium]|nr:beta-propeller domain-containing protein [Candidatus Dojkabacteria bacterium]
MNKHARLLGILAGTVLLGSIVVISLIALSRFVDFGGSSPLGATYKQVASCSELAERMNKQVYYPYYADGIDLAVPEAARDSVTTGAGSAEYSTTNVQVAGVDEADIIKTDGAYIYVATNNAVFIIDAEDPSLENYLAKIDIEDDATARGLFVQGDNLVIFADSYGYGVMPVLEMGMGMADEEATISSRYQNLTTVLVYDTSDVREPMLVRTTEVEGNYQTSRMIDQRVYIVGNYYPNYYQNVSASEVEELIPRISDSAGNKTAGQMAQCDQVALFGNEGRNFVTVVTLDLGDESFLGSQVLVGNAQTVYMSESSLVLAATEYPSVETTENWCSRMGMCPTPVTSQADPQTLLFKLGISTTGVDFAASGVVPGTLLNQFSLDEHSGYLRVVTTVDNWGVRQDLSVNNLYVLDGSLGQVGAVEDLAMGERVYSARFMGDRAYMVTFQTIDPLFVIDLSNPEDPKVLGELKIPG